MSSSPYTWVGVDPGGKGAFGVAVMREGAPAELKVVDCADEAVEFVLQHIQVSPNGVGIDAPLWWSSGLSSDRRADQWLRATYGLSGGQVQSVNSLRGAALVQAAMFMQRLREHYPAVPVTEAHPKAILSSKVFGDWPAFANRYGIRLKTPTDHERDALIAAISAREGFEGRWGRDLSVDRGPREQDTTRYWLAPVHYFWPSE